jgi:hypothetical protein
MASSAALALACLTLWREPDVRRPEIVTTLTEARGRAPSRTWALV